MGHNQPQLATAQITMKPLWQRFDLGICSREGFGLGIEIGQENPTEGTFEAATVQKYTPQQYI